MTLPPARRVLELTSNFPRWVGDSTTPFVLSLSEDLIELGWEVEVLAPHAPGAARHEAMGKVAVHRFRYLLPESAQSVCYGGGAMVNLRKRRLDYAKLPALLAAEAAAVARRIRAFRPHVVHAHWLLPQGFVAGLVCTALDVPLVTTIHGSDLFSLRSKAYTPFKHFALWRANAVTVNSTVTQAAVRNLARSDQQIQLIPMGADPGSPQPELVQQILKRHRHGAGPLLVFLGRMVEEKGAGDLIDAAAHILAELPDARLLLIGEGQDRAELEQRARTTAVADRITFLGWVDRSQVPSYLAAADVFVGPSKRGSDGTVEGQGLTFAEALLAGTPVVATDCGGIADLVRHEETGLVVPQADPEAIAKAVIRLQRSPELAQQLAARGQAVARTGFSRQQTARQFDSLFRELLES